MIIKKYKCSRFAGIKDKNVDFLDGINVLLGDNEAGKSTLVEGIYSVMFKSTRFDKRSTEDKNFYAQFMPIPNGDSIDGEIILSSDEGDFVLAKEWGAKPFSKLMMPNADMIKSEDKIQNILKEILKFGEGTFSSILFSKQIHIKEALEKIMGNKETTSEVSTLIRKAIMELDGVSIDDLSLKIDSEIDLLLKKWDIEKSYPENNRGVNNPYKVGIGQVVDYFYKKENIHLEMEEAEQKEKHFDDICNQLKSMEANLSELKDKKEAMEKLENDVINRSILEPKIFQYDKEQASIMKINQEWPQYEMRLKQINEELKRLSSECEKLQIEKVQAGKVGNKNVLMKNIKKIDELKFLMKKTDDEINMIKVVTTEDIISLDKLYKEIITTEAKMKAGVMIGKVTCYSLNSNIIITKDLDEPEIINVEDNFKANGYIKIESENSFGIELKSGDMDFYELRNLYLHNKKNLELKLNALMVKSIEEAKLNKEKLDNLRRNLENLNKQILNILGEYNYDDLKKELESFGDLSQIRDIETIEAEIKAITEQQIELLSTKKSIESSIIKWSEEFKDIDGLLNKIIEIRISQKSDRENLEKLAPLPEQYENAEIFRHVLTETRKTFENSQLILSKLKEDYYESENNLPESTCEELNKEYEYLDGLFNKALGKGKKLLKIKESFQSTKLAMDENSFAPLSEAFSNYIIQLTNGNVKAGDIGNDFSLKLEKDKQTYVPIHLLSAGTYDSVALALKLAILEYILGDDKGFMILDDCFVDLDPTRKEAAVQMIKSFAKKHQIIFTTCSPETAKLLGGNIIMMQ